MTEQSTPDCPVCFGQGEELGVLGWCRYFRCRDCGIEFSEAVSREEANERKTGQSALSD
jgi:tRNA(Ile2) C34 agmatinyltransferase TiaS